MNHKVDATNIPPLRDPTKWRPADGNRDRIYPGKIWYVDSEPCIGPAKIWLADGEKLPKLSAMLRQFIMPFIVALVDTIMLVAVAAISLLAVVFLAAFAAAILPALVVVVIAAESRRHLEKDS